MTERALSWNPAAQRLYGYAACEIRGHSIARIIPAELQREQRERLIKIRGGWRVVYFETVRPSQRGGRVNVSVSVSPVRDSAGTIVGAAEIAYEDLPRRHLSRALAGDAFTWKILMEIEESCRKI